MMLVDDVDDIDEDGSTGCRTTKSVLGQDMFPTLSDGETAMVNKSLDRHFS